MPTIFNLYLRVNGNITDSPFFLVVITDLKMVLIPNSLPMSVIKYSHSSSFSSGKVGWELCGYSLLFDKCIRAHTISPSDNSKWAVHIQRWLLISTARIAHAHRLTVTHSASAERCMLSLKTLLPGQLRNGLFREGVKLQHAVLKHRPQHRVGKVKTMREEVTMHWLKVRDGGSLQCASLRPGRLPLQRCWVEGHPPVSSGWPVESGRGTSWLDWKAWCREPQWMPMALG